VADLDKVTQQNASLVEESTAASEQLRELAVEMTEAVSVFRMAEGKAAALPAPKAAVKLSARPAPRALPKGAAGSARLFPKKAIAATAGGDDHWKEF
jgi:hypothetical protein